jgi:predicted Kef-type K+ transport protein
MIPILVVAAFVCGALVSTIGLPPLVGYLVAGFALNGLEIQGDETLQTIADAGVTLLLFTIGLKLRLKSLTSPVIWAGATLHMLLTIIFFGAGIGILSVIGLAAFAALDIKTVLLIAFALSFSSTVFAVKVFEEKNEMAARHALQRSSKMNGQCSLELISL